MRDTQRQSLPPLARLVVALGACAVLVLATAWPMSALSISTASVTFTAVALDGTAQTTPGSTSAWRADASGESGGWNVTVSAVEFSDGGTKTIAVSGHRIRLLGSNIVLVSGDPTGPSSTQTTFTALSSTPLKLLSASVGDGDGVYDITPEFELAVPAESFAAAYTATVTVAINVGP